MALTPRNIWTPDAGDGYALVTDLGTFADSVDGAIDGSVGTMGTDVTALQNTNKVYDYRPADAAARSAITGMREGDRAYQIDTKVEYKYVGTTWIPQGANVAYRIATPVNVATATETTLDLDASPTVLLGGFTESAGVVTMPYAGNVIVTTQAIIASGGSPTLYQLRVFKNGTTNNILSVYQVPATSRVLNGTGMVRVAAGDTLRVRAFQNSGGTVTVGEVNSDSPILIIQYIN